MNDFSLHTSSHNGRAPTLTEHDLTMIDTLRQILARQLPSAEAIPTTLPPHWRGLPYQLYSILQQTGRDNSFWHRYDTLAADYPRMSTWRPFILASPQPEPHPSLTLDTSPSPAAQPAPTEPQIAFIDTLQQRILALRSAQAIPPNPPASLPALMANACEESSPVGTDLSCPASPATQHTLVGTDLSCPATFATQATPDTIGKHPATSNKPSHKPTMPHKSKLLLTITEQPITFAWHPRIPFGKLTILEGDPGIGKSTLLYTLEALLSTASPLPDGSPAPAGGLSSILISLEDGLATTIKPRLLRAGADLARIWSLSTLPIELSSGRSYERPFTLPDDLHTLDTDMTRSHARFVHLDPLSALLSHSDLASDTAVRRQLLPLQALAEKHNAAIILVRHLNKRHTDNPLYQGSGSIVFNALARSVLRVTPDPQDDSRLILAHIKSNVAELAPPLRFHITSDKTAANPHPYITWDGVSPLTNRELFARPKPDRPPSTRDHILLALRIHYPEAISLEELVRVLPHLSKTNITTTLSRLANEGAISRSITKGHYTALPT